MQEQSHHTPDIDWHSADLTPDTVISASYRNPQNVRRLFKAQIGPEFTFNRPFMAWMKANTGQPLSAAVIAFREMK